MTDTFSLVLSRCNISASSHSLHLLRQTDLQSIISSLHQNRQLKLGRLTLDVLFAKHIRMVKGGQQAYIVRTRQIRVCGF